MTDLTLFLEGLEAWHWLSLAVGLIIIELAFVGAYVLLCIGAAAAVVGAAFMLVPALTWQAQIAIWAVLSIAGIAGWSLYKKANPNAGQSDEPLLNNRGAQYVGRALTLEIDIADGDNAQHKVDDSFWTLQARGDLKQGMRVTVVESKSTVLVVAAAAS